jgi:hypothetical protein
MGMIVGFVVVAIIARHAGKRYARRRMFAARPGHSLSPYVISRPTSRAARRQQGLRGYVRSMREVPAFWARVVALVTMLASTWLTAGFHETLLAVAIGVFIAFTVGYGAWRRWGPGW